MFEVVGRDGAARRARWELPSGDVVTPTVAHPATARHDPPDFAELVVARDDPGVRPWVQDLGSAFDPRERASDADAAIPPGLSYPAGVGDRVHERARDYNEDEDRQGRIGLTPIGDPVDVGGAEALLAPGVAPLLDRPRKLAEALAALRSVAYQRALWLPGVGLPHDLALLTYAGVDVVDATPVLWAARQGRFLTPEGPLEADEASRATCPCPACLGEMDGYAWLREHNLHVQRAEMARVRQAIDESRLRALVETRVHARPPAVAVLRHLDRDHGAFLEERTPVHRNRRLDCPTAESLHMPEVARYRDRLRQRYEPPAASILLVLPCSAYKPYAESRTHRRLRKALKGLGNRWAVHECVLTSPLGVVPRELERCYPASEYDLPVSGHWDPAEEALIRDLLETVLERGDYAHVVAHLPGDEAALVADVAPKAEATAVGDPRSGESLSRLSETLRALTDAAPHVDYQDRLREELAEIAAFQFGPDGRRLVDDARIEGSWPRLRLFDGDDLLATLVPSRGRYTLALEGGRRLLSAGVHTVEIEDFVPKGSVFAVGVEDADPGIRVEDDVVCHHDGEIRAVGRAEMPGPEMVESDRGAALEAKHHA